MKQSSTTDPLQLTRVLPKAQMHESPEVQLVQFASGLKEAERGVVRGLTDSDWELYLEHVQKFNELRRQIKSILSELPAITIHNPAARETIRQVSLDAPFLADKVASKVASLCAGGAIANMDVCTLPDEEADIFAEVLHPRYDPKEYLRNLYEIGCLILGIPVPKLLLAFVSAARDSYASGNYLAVLSLCRTMLEVALRDMAERRRLIERDPTDAGYLSAWIRRKVTPAYFRDSVEELYKRTSLLIHGRASTDRDEAREVFRTTLEIIHGTYKHYGLG